MTLLDAAYWVTCVVLVVSGLAKLGDPGPTESTLRALRLPAPSGAGRALGVSEVVLGAAGLGTALAPVAVGVAVLYVAFAGIVAAARRAGLADCGCLGVRESRPTRAHVVANLLSAAVAVAAATQGPVAVADGLATLAWPVALLAGLAVAGAAGAVIAWEGRG